MKKNLLFSSILIGDIFQTSAGFEMVIGKVTTGNKVTSKDYLILHSVSKDTGILIDGSDLNILIRKIESTDEKSLDDLKYLRHINQENDFIDSNGLLLRNGINFVDKDNKEDASKEWQITVTKALNTDDEITYNQKEFTRDCTINTDQINLERRKISDEVLFHKNEIEKKGEVSKFLEKVVNYFK